MRTKFICPRTGNYCDNPPFCEVANKPLLDVIPRIRRDVEGVRWKLVETALNSEITTQGDLLGGVEFNPVFEQGGTVRICPNDVIRGDFGVKYGAGAAATAISRIMSAAIYNATSDLSK